MKTIHNFEQKTLGSLFAHQPDFITNEGDIKLWKDLKTLVTRRPLPDTEQELEMILQVSYKLIVRSASMVINNLGYPHSYKFHTHDSFTHNPVQLETTVDFWETKLLPYLLNEQKVLLQKTA